MTVDRAPRTWTRPRPAAEPKPRTVAPKAVAERVREDHEAAAARLREALEAWRKLREQLG